MNRGWKNGRVGELISSLESGISVNGEDGEPSDNDQAVLKVSAVTYGKFNPNASKKISGHELQRAKCIPKKSQIIISRSNTPELVGASCYVDKDYPNRFLPDKLWQTVPRKDIDVDLRWLAYFLASPWARFRLSNLATGTSKSMKNITKGELLRLQVPIPPYREQQEIASFLKHWDKAIEKTEALIAAKEKQFEWLKHKLLIDNQNSTHWKTNPLGHYIEEKKDKSTTPDLYLCLTSSRRGMFLQDEYFSKQVASKNNTGYKIMSRGDFTYRSMSDDGTFVFNKQEIVDKGLISPAYGVFSPNKNMNADFLYYFLNSSAFKRALAREVQGGTRTALKLNALKKLDVDIPDLYEQEDIAYKLNTAQSEIALLKKTLEQYRLQKRGLMQKLLTGEWQVSTQDQTTEKARKELSKELTEEKTA